MRRLCTYSFLYPACVFVRVGWGSQALNLIVGWITSAQSHCRPRFIFLFPTLCSLFYGAHVHACVYVCVRVYVLVCMCMYMCMRVHTAACGCVRVCRTTLQRDFCRATRSRHVRCICGAANRHCTPWPHTHTHTRAHTTHARTHNVCHTHTHTAAVTTTTITTHARAAQRVPRTPVHAHLGS